MIRPHSPNETPTGKSAHSGGGGAWSSPWELDQEWQDAPQAKQGAGSFAKDELDESPPEPVPKSAPAPVLDKVEAVASMSTPDRATTRKLPGPLRVQRTRNTREGLWGTLVILSMGALAFVFIAWIYIEDDKSAGFDQDLLLRHPVDQAANISTPEKLKKFLAAITSFDGTAALGKPPWLWDTPTLSRIVQSNGTALDNLRDLLEDVDWHPNHSAWHAEDIGSDPRWHQAMVLKQVEAAYLSRRQLEEDAFTAAIDLAELGWRLEQMQAWPSFYQRSMEAQTCAAQTLGDLLRQTKLTESTLRQFQRQFSVCQPSAELLANAMNAFYVHEKKLILGPKSGENLDTMPGGAQLQRPGRLLFKPNATVQLFATAFRQMRDETKVPLVQTSVIRLEGAQAAEGALQPNAKGHEYFTERMSTYTPLPALLGITRARGSLVITLFAIRRCIAEKKTLPTTLEQLRSLNYLLDVPADPYTGAPLQYNPARGLIWSVGNDLKSVGGAPTEPPMNDASEPTLETGIAVAGTVR